MPSLDNFGRRERVTGICHYVNGAGDEGKDSCGQKNGLHNVSISNNKIAENIEESHSHLHHQLWQSHGRIALVERLTFCNCLINNIGILWLQKLKEDLGLQLSVCWTHDFDREADLV